MEAPGDARLPTVSLGSLQPYVSVLLLEPDTGDAAAVFAECAEFLREPASQRMQATVTLVAAGVDEPVSRFPPLLDLTALVHRVERSPGWQVPGSGFADVEHALTVVARTGDMVAVLTDPAFAPRLQRLLDGPARAGRRVAEDVLQYAFLRGEAKGLWLRGAHAPRTTKPDSKMSAGRRLQDSLDPVVDGTYSLASGRAALVPDSGRVALRGSVGTTPHRGLVWTRRADSMADFADVLGDLFREVRLARDVPAGGRGVFTELAGRVADLAGVHGAFDIGFSGLDVTPGVDLDDEALRAAADLLERATFAVTGSAEDTSFRLDVEVDGARRPPSRAGSWSAAAVATSTWSSSPRPTSGSPVRCWRRSTGTTTCSPCTTAPSTRTCTRRGAQPHPPGAVPRLGVARLRGVPGGPREARHQPGGRAPEGGRPGRRLALRLGGAPLPARLADLRRRLR
ncbi:hypothetical protein BJF78_27085 [Pseudonocardia sp. CNS-139]|nr:hypothetical protein BJF78_27085 [Pseudonocardia sp. CNS-139]